MLDTRLEQLVIDTVDGHVKAGNSFSAFDITREIRVGGDRVKHADVREKVHGLYFSGAMAGYTRELRPVWSGGQAFFYMPLVGMGNIAGTGGATTVMVPTPGGGGGPVLMAGVGASPLRSYGPLAPASAPMTSSWPASDPDPDPSPPGDGSGRGKGSRTSLDPIVKRRGRRGALLVPARLVRAVGGVPGGRVRVSDSLSGATLLLALPMELPGTQGKREYRVDIHGYVEVPSRTLRMLGGIMGDRVRIELLPGTGRLIIKEA